MADSRVDWYGSALQAVLDNAKNDVLTAAAFLCEAQTKVNITENDQVDTGFMRASTYTIEASGDYNRNETMASGTYTGDKSGETNYHENAQPLDPPKGVAAVHVAANYAIYQESKKSFLYKGAKQVVDKLGGKIKEISRENKLD